jgi:hypothetical protein
MGLRERGLPQENDVDVPDVKSSPTMPAATAPSLEKLSIEALRPAFLEKPISCAKYGCRAPSIGIVRNFTGKSSDRAGSQTQGSSLLQQT